MQHRSHRPAPAATYLRHFVLAALLGSAATAMGQSDANLVASSAERHYAVPLFVATTDPAREGLLRIINRSDHAGVVEVHAIDDAGVRVGSVALALEAGAVHHLHPRDLERGAQDYGGVGAGHGDWRLELVTALDIAPLAYVRNAAGGVSHVDAVSIVNNGGICEIPFFNPAGHRPEHSRLRLTNPGSEPAWVTIAGLDDAGLRAPGGDVRLTVPPGATRTVTADELESGAVDLDGRLGEGTGRWRLSVSSSAHVDVVNLLVDSTGGLSVPGGCEPPATPGYPGNVVVHHDAGPWGADSYRPGDAGIVGDTLRVTVSYGGGCADHAFTLVLADAFQMMDPPRLPATLAHQANGDPCEAWLTETLEFDLTPLKELHGGTGTVVLALVFADGTERELRYTF